MISLIRTQLINNVNHLLIPPLSWLRGGGGDNSPTDGGNTALISGFLLPRMRIPRQMPGQILQFFTPAVTNTSNELQIYSGITQSRVKPTD